MQILGITLLNQKISNICNSTQTQISVTLQSSLQNPLLIQNSLKYCLMTSGNYNRDSHFHVLASALSCLILCDPVDYSAPGSSVRGILQARILEWVAIPSCRGSSQARDQTQVSGTARGFFTVWATREALSFPMDHDKWRAETQPLIAA